MHQGMLLSASGRTLQVLARADRTSPTANTRGFTLSCPLSSLPSPYTDLPQAAEAVAREWEASPQSLLQMSSACPQRLEGEARGLSRSADLLKDRFPLGRAVAGHLGAGARPRVRD